MTVDVWVRLWCVLCDAQAVNGLSAVVTPGVREVQVVRTRTDPGFPITYGTFTLSFNQEVRTCLGAGPTATRGLWRVRRR